MTDTTQKISEEFNKLMDKLWDKYGESYEVYNPKEFTREIESFLATSIKEAVAEERSKLLLELLQVFNDYDVPLTMTAEQVRDILEEYLTKKD